MTRHRAGFTLIELLVVILIGSILVGVAISSFQGAMSQFATSGAANQYATFHQRARAKAIELGRTMILIVDTQGDSAFIIDWVQSPPSFTVTDIVNIRRELNVDMRSSVSSFLICMTPRGYADPNCPSFGFTTWSTPLTVEFWQGADSSSVTILPMGQIVGM